MGQAKRMISSMRRLPESAMLILLVLNTDNLFVCNTLSRWHHIAAQLFLVFNCLHVCVVGCGVGGVWRVC